MEDEQTADQVFGVALISTTCTYHSLLDLSESGQTESYRFWQSVFGPCLHGRLYFFSVQEAWSFANKPALPILNWSGVRTFFMKLPEGGVTLLIENAHRQAVDLPAWFRDAAEAPCLCVRLPAAFAHKVTSGRWSSFALPEPALEQLFHGGERQRSRLMGWSHCPFDAQHFVQPPYPEPDDNGLSMSTDTAAFVAKTIRQCAASLNNADPEVAELLQACHMSAAVLQRCQDELDEANVHEGVLAIRGRVAATSARLAYDALFLVKCMLLVYHLRDAASLRKVLQRSIEIVIPKTFAGVILETLQPGKLQIPSPTKISRSRLTLDAAFMLCQREKHNSPERDCIRYMVADSSVQGHHDFLLVRCTTLDLAKSGDMYTAAREVFSIWQCMLEEGILADEDYVLETCFQEQDRQAVIRSGLEEHLFPSAVIGSGHASLFHKYHALMHTCLLETGSAVSLARFTDSIFSFTTEQGTEYGFPQTPPVSVDSLFPWLPVPPQVLDEHDWAPGPDEAALHRAACVDLSQSVGIAGLLHIVHNSCKDFTAGMQHFDTVVQQLQHVSKLLRKKDTRERLLESCFNDATGRLLRGTIRKFHAKLHVGRWGSLAECVRQMVQVETVLRWGWNLESYGRQQRQDSGSDGVDLALVNGAVTSPFFWSYVHMLKTLTDTIHAALTWAESCPCHSHLNLEQLTKRVRQQVQKCPLRGCRAPELSNGDFQRHLRTVADTGMAHFLTTLPRDIDAVERGSLIRDFQHGKAHLFFILSLRLQHWRVPPWSVFGCADLREEVSKTFLRRTLELRSEEPLVCKVQTGDLAAQARQYIESEDASLQNLPILRSFLGQLLFCPIAERRVEGDHAQAGCAEFHICSNTRPDLAFSHCHS